jgi:hypothetical protein
MQTFHKMSFVATLTLALAYLLAGCANQRTDLSDEASMAVYRDCINAMPQGPNAHSVGSTLSHSGAGQPVSISAAVSSNAQAQKDVDCARMAGWKK